MLLLSVLLLSLMMISSSLSWWISIWVCTLVMDMAVCMCYTSMGVWGCSCSGLFNYDYLSCSMVWLSVFITGLSLLSSGSVLSMKDSESSFLICLLVLMIILVISFSVSSLLVFYIFFETSLIPTFLIICGWGYQPERLRASKFMMLYTVGASLPLLAFILCVFYSKGSVMFGFLSLSGLMASSFFAFLVGITAFLVKVPMYGLHMWLPKAHVEASVAGSMLLAGVLLKMGGYGLARFMSFFQMSNSLIMSCVMCLCIVGGTMGSVICCFQLDVKSLIAYSSVGHMSLVLCGFMSGSFLGFVGACLLMVAHGLSSPGMFYLASEMYSLFGSRSMLIIRGMTGSLTGINFWLMVMCSFSAAAPPSLSICSEVILYISLMNYSLLFCLFLGSMSFVSCLYSWLVYCNTQTGNYPNWVRSSSNVSSLYLQGVVCSSLSFPLIALCLYLQ